ncbi:MULTISPECIES: hypothetical protein [Nocardia]|uniref:hypothetical protein n=1 Tax=Nocardia TaxID=1817 RepID=UPI0024538709|nr:MULTISPECIES: hypothetical protein [Nocardia]
MTTQAVTQRGPVTLTSHPLQRVGAFALMSLAGVDDPDRDPESLTSAEFEAAVAVMRANVAATAELPDSKASGAFWLSASYLLWPNSPMNWSGRAKASPQRRRELIEAWRTYPRDRIGAPCSLCGSDACGWYGKVDIPLGASVYHRNTTAPGHQGQPLCAGCLGSLHALPYGCHIGPTAYTVHSWDDAFLRRATIRQVPRTRAHAAADDRLKAPARGEREADALDAVAEHDRALAADIELIEFSNSNRDPFLKTWTLRQTVAEWIRCVRRDPESTAALEALTRVVATPKFGATRFAHMAFRAPDRVLAATADHLYTAGPGEGIDLDETAVIARLCISLARVL